MERKDNGTVTTSAERDASNLAGAGVPFGADALPDQARATVDVEGAAAASPVDPGSSIAAWLFHLDLPAREVDSADVPRLIGRDQNFVWLDLSAFRADDLRALGAALRLHPTAVHMTLSAWQRPRLDVFDDLFFVSATVPRADHDALRVEAGELDLFVGRNLLLSAHKRPLPFADEVMARARQSPALMQRDSAYLLYILLDELLEHYEGLSEGVADQIERIEERALLDASDTFLSDLLRVKRFTYALSRLAQQHREVLAAFLRPDFPFVARDEMEPYFRDLEARLERLTGDLQTATDAVTGAFDIYVSRVAHGTNHIMKVLTIVSSMLLPATVILGVFGTNFRGVPLYSAAAFVVMLLCIALTTGVTLYVFRRRRWI